MKLLWLAPALAVPLPDVAEALLTDSATEEQHASAARVVDQGVERPRRRYFSR